jgi:DNA (cytosine-5)-methyltransferase 1
MKYGSICSGIEAATVAWHSLGWEPAWFSEIASFPSALLDHYYPTVPNLGDMTKLTGMIERREIDAPDIVCGGTPCQAFSISGTRKSLDDTRGNLSLVFCEVCNAVDDIRHDRNEQPAIIMWENVPGVLSTHDNAFGCFLAGLAGESEPVNAPGGRWPTAGIIVGARRSIAWRVLDAQYFGLAQRRKRVFVVASARADIDIGQVLFEFDGVQRTTKPRRETGQGDTRATAVGVDADSGMPTLARELSHTLKTTTNEAVFVGTEDVSPTLRANAKQSLMSGSGDINSPLAISIQGNIIDRNHGGAQGVGISTEDISYTLTTADRHAVAFRSPVVIRRLTPRECERLQGFPDDYTLIPYRGKDASDAVRYHALGNSWAVSVVRWIGRRIVTITKQTIVN